MLQVNIRSLRKNWDEYVITIANSKVKWDIIVLSEINIKKYEHIMYTLPEYNSFVITRESTKRGGGICMFVRDKITAVYKKIKIDTNDGIWATICINEIEWNIFALYRQPCTNKLIFIDELKKYLEDNIELTDNVIILGDLNIDILKTKEKINGVPEKFENLMAGKGFEAKIESSTRQEKLRDKMCESCIDHIFIRSKKHQSKGYVWKKKISDHYFTLLTIELNTENVENQTNIQQGYLLKDDSIVKELRNVDWRFLDEIQDTNIAYEEIKNKIQNIYQNNQVLKKTKPKKGTVIKQWMNDAILEKITIKNKLWSKMSKTKNYSRLEEYKKLRNEVTSLINKAKQSYYFKLLEGSEKDSKKLWDTIKTITGKKKKMNVEEQLRKHFPNINVKKLGNDFNGNFAKMVPKLKQKYQNSPNTLNVTHRVRHKFVDNKCKETMAVHYANIEDICTILREIKNTNATGIDGFYLKHFKNSIFNTSIMVTKLINKIIDTEKWPDELKTQVLRPIYKNGKKNDLNNYRPIALLPLINKIIEKFFTKQITAFFDKYNLLSTRQYGFKKHIGTRNALSDVNDMVTHALNKGKYVAAILIDLQKAFDTVDHSILLKKCNQMGLRGKMNNIIKNYMTNRKSVVKINSDHSELENINFGVPQGSVLGPILFLIYINDIEQCINNTQLYLFADDIVLFSINDDYTKMLKNLQNDFNVIVNWCKDNELFINEKKTQYICINSAHKNRPESQYPIRIHNTTCNLHDCNNDCSEIVETKAAKYLGFIMDDKWSYNKHIDLTITKLRKIMPSLYRIKHLLNNRNKRILYYSWVESIIRYGLGIYGHANKTQIDRIQKVQNKIVKILFRHSNTISSNEIFKTQNLLNVRALRDHIIISENYFKSEFKQVTTNKAQLLRQSTYRYNVPFAFNEYGKRCRNYTVPTLFNKLPKKLIELDGLRKAKKEIKLWMVNSEWEKS